MKIAQVAPLAESVPPKYYGGTERIVSYLTEALVEMGHDVTLYASGDSVTKARLRAMCPAALRLDRQSVDPVADHVLLAERVFRDAHEFDLIHSHMDYLAYPLLRRIGVPHLTTLHGRLDIQNLRGLYREFEDIPVVSVSDSQRGPLPRAFWQGTVHHGIPEKLYAPCDRPGKYLAVIRRISHEKRLDDAILIAKHSGMPLKIAAKVDKVDHEYFETLIKPQLNEPFIEYIGEIGDAAKNEFLGNAYALLFPIDWPEPFGLVVIEAMACGTPVIARRRGSVPEILKDGVTGFIVNDTLEAVQAVSRISQLDRHECRREFERRFTASRMAADYLEIYKNLSVPAGARSS